MSALRKSLHAIECEQAVIGAVLLNNEQYWPAKEAGLEAVHFASALHQRLWLAIEGLVKIGHSANGFTLHARFRDDADMAGQGGPAKYFGALAANAPTVALLRGIGDLAREIVEWANRRALVDLSSQVERAATDAETPAVETMDRIEAVIGDLRQVGTTGGLQPMPKIMEATLEIADRAHKRGRVEGVETGLRAIDRILGGMANTDMIVLAGRPGMGKSALAGTIAQHVAQSNLVALFSLEMAAEQFASRMVAGEAEVDASRLRKGEISAQEMHRVIEAGEKMKALRLEIDATPQITPADMRARLKRLARAGKVGLIVVDYIQLMRGDTARRDGNRVLEISEITGALKAMAKEFGCPMLALSQLSRAVEQRDDKRPMLADLRDSGSIEQDADQVWFLYRDEYYARREEPPIGASGERVQRWQDRLQAGQGRAELIVAKNRHGPDETLQLRFDGRFARFGNME